MKAGFIAMSKDTPAKRAKQLGAKSLKQIAKAWGCDVSNLHHKFESNREQFEIIVIGVVNRDR